MKNYYRIFLGKKNTYAAEGVANNFIGANFEIPQDLSQHLPDEWRLFNREFIPIYLKNHPDKTRVAAGLACGMLHTVAKGIRQGDIVLCPDGEGHYHVGEVSGGYYYQPDGILPHRRPVAWFPDVIDRSEMSDSLKQAAAYTGAVCNLSKYSEELERLIKHQASNPIFSKDETIENPSAFAMEQHLEEFLVENWKHTDLGKQFNIYELDGDLVGEQFPTDTGPIDILAISKDKKVLLVIELKKGRASDAVIGQILRYMGYVQEELAEVDQSVKGAIIALEDDQRIRRALAVSPNISFYRYQISFKIVKG